MRHLHHKYTISLLKKYETKHPIKIFGRDVIMEITNVECKELRKLEYIGLISTWFDIKHRTVYAQTTHKGLAFI